MSYLAICPTGTVFPFAGTTAPNGWLLCNGSAISRTVYSQLFAVLGSANGSGDGSTTFNIPDYRGRFLRGVTGASANDPDNSLRIAMASGGNTGNAVGSVQGIATSISSGTQGNTKATQGVSNNAFTVPSTSINLNHGHALSMNPIPLWGNGGLQLGTVAVGDNNNQSTSYTPTGSASSATLNANHGHSVLSGGITFSGDQETRPINAYVNYIIKV